MYERKYYRYSESDFTITNTPLNATDINTLTDAVSMLRQFKDFSLFKDISAIVQRLEDKVYAEKHQSSQVIHLDKNEQLKGLHFLDGIYQAIIKKVVLQITYRSFTARAATAFTFHPYAIKEYNNRWFVLGKRKARDHVSNLALDRIEAIDYDFKTPHLEEPFDIEAHYKNVIGVTVSPTARTRKVILRIDQMNAPYVITKPLHPSQQLLTTFADQSIKVEINVQLNRELERIILGFGNGIEVLGPKGLRNRIAHLHKSAAAYYKPTSEEASGSTKE